MKNLSYKGVFLEGKEEAVDRYRVRYWHLDEDGREEFVGFGSMEQAQEFYRSMDGLAEIHQYNEDRHCYEAIIYPEFEY